MSRIHDADARPALHPGGRAAPAAAPRRATRGIRLAWALGLLSAALFGALALYLAPLQPGVLALQLAAMPSSAAATLTGSVLLALAIASASIAAPLYAAST